MAINWKSIILKLKTLLGDEQVTDNPLDLLCYSKDSSIETGEPNVVVFPKTTEEVVEIVKLAALYKAPIIPRGSG